MSYTPFRIASETCQYALPEQRLGQIPGSGGSARLQKMVGITRTKDLVMRSKRIVGRQAYEWGVATECVPDDKLEAATDALVGELLDSPEYRGGVDPSVPLVPDPIAAETTIKPAGARAGAAKASGSGQWASEP